MHALAGIYVTLVAVFNTLIPQANLPQVLGVSTDSRAAQVVSQKETQKSELKTRLLNLKDENKRVAVFNVNERLTMQQEKWTEYWSRVLTRLDETLNKIKLRRDEAQKNGKNVNDVNVAIAEAEVAIQTAKDAVANQAAKTYPIVISTDAKVGESTRSTISTYSKDIKATAEAVRLAVNAVTKVSKKGAITNVSR